MSVGIMDADMSTYLLVPFNLEVMKLSAYYKKKGEIVILSPSFSPDRNTKFIYRKDYDDGDYPIDLTLHNNVEYGGLAFSKNKYAPLPMEIELMKPDTSIYGKMERIICNGQNTRKKIYQNMINCEHARLSLDGKTIWQNYPRQFNYLPSARNLMLHDYDLGAIPGSFEEVQKIMASARKDGWATKIGMKFPVCINDGQSLLNWSSLNPNSTYYSLRYNGVIDNDAFVEWVGKCREKSCFTQMEYYITQTDCSEQEFINQKLQQILHQIIISRSYRVFFTLKYDWDYFTDKRWCDVIQLFNYYHNSYANEPASKYLIKINDDTVFDFAANCQKNPKSWYGDVFNLQKIREIFAFVREFNYPLFQDFYECSARKLGGKP